MSRYDVYLRAVREGSTTAPYVAWHAERLDAWMRLKDLDTVPPGWTYIEHRRAVLFANEPAFDAWLPLNP